MVACATIGQTAGHLCAAGPAQRHEDFKGGPSAVMAGNALGGGGEGGETLLPCNLFTRAKNLGTASIDTATW